MAEITKGEIKSVFNSAIDYRSGQKKSLNPLKRLGSLKKDQVSFQDLYSEWVSSGSPEDTNEISDILTDKFGYSEKDVKKIFDQVFGKDQDPSGEQTAKLADFIKKYNLTNDVISFIEREYRDTLFNQKPGLFKKKKVVYEDIRKIFELVQKEERPERASLLQSKEAESIGRKRK